MENLAINEIKENKENVEERLLDELSKYKILGELYREFGGITEKSIDALGIPEHGNIVFIIEAKRKINYSAIGQVFVYEYIYNLS